MINLTHKIVSTETEFESFREAVKNVEKLNPGAKVRVGSMADFYNSIIKENHNQKKGSAKDAPIPRGC